MVNVWSDKDGKVVYIQKVEYIGNGKWRLVLADGRIFDSFKAAINASKN